MKIGGFDTHPAADIYPLIEDKEFDDLVESVKRNGLLDDIVLIGSGEKARILDGRNRLRACLKAKVKARFTQYRGKDDVDTLIAYVESKNDHRRHLSPSQRALIAARKSELRNGQRPVGATSDKRTQRENAELHQVSVRSLAHGRAVLEGAIPAVVAAVDKKKLAIDAAAQLAKLPRDEQKHFADRINGKGGGEVRSGHVRALIRQSERRKTVAKINTNRVPSVGTLAGPFGVMLWDPPWWYDNSDDHPGARGHMKYPPMKVEAIIELGRQFLTRLCDDAVIFTWATNPLMPLAVDVVRALGLQWQSMGTWTKSRMGMGPKNMRSRTEHYAVATRGNPVHTLNEVSTWLGDRALDVGEHSEKPVELHEVIEKHCSGPYLEAFARAPRAGWTVWGAEADKFEERQLAGAA